MPHTPEPVEAPDISARSIYAQLFHEHLNTEERTYLDYHAERLAFAVNLVGSYVNDFQRAGRAPVRVLDVGPHFLTAALRRHIGRGIVLNTLGWENHRLAAPGEIDHHIQFDLNDAQNAAAWPTPAEHDIVMMAEVIEHLYTSPLLVLSFINTLVARGGVLILQTPNAVAVSKRVQMLLGRNPYEMIREARDNPGHFREYTADELRALCQAIGLEVERTIYGAYWRVGRVARILGAIRPGFRSGLTLVARKP